MSNKYLGLVEKLQKNNLNSVTRDNSFPISEKRLQEMEQNLNHILPEDYRDFLRYLNTYEEFIFSGVHYRIHCGGFEEKGTLFVFYSRPDEDYRLASVNCDSLPISYYPGLALVRGVDPSEEISWPEELLPIATDKGGNAVCLALSSLRPGAIFFWRDSPIEGFQNVYLIANSFDEFMHLLYRPTN